MRTDGFTIEMLGHSVLMSSVDPVVLDTLASVFGDLRALDTCRVGTELRVRVGGGDHEFVLDMDGREEWSGSSLASVVHECVTRLNRVAVDRCTSLAVHAGGVQREGVGVLLPAPSGSGKSTLTAGLVRAGLGYLSDEAVALDWDTHLVQPYPKPISLDPGAFALFPEWAPPFVDGHDVTTDAQWHIAPSRTRAGSVGSPCEVAFIVFPEFRSRVSTRLEPISKGSALLEMCKNTFRFNQQGRKALDHLAAIVHDATCYRLPMGSLDSAVRSVLDLVGPVET